MDEIKLEMAFVLDSSHFIDEFKIYRTLDFLC